MDGIILIDKEKGWTSHDVVAKLRNILNTKRIGHSGTLDPDATGLLVILIGAATKKSSAIMAGKKVYRALIRLGIETDSYDATGIVISRKRAEDITEVKVKKILDSFVGEIRQKVPVVSAVKVNGRPLYAYARKGIEVDTPVKTVHIYKMDLMSITKEDNPVLDVNIECGSGTYIRSLASDIGKSLGCGAHIQELRRTASGGFYVKDAASIAEIARLAGKGDTASFLIPVNGVANEA